ncbi:hypothetical protein PLESTM_000574400 [Pleodorina starrii]|nr:hypothetical protein PLESTM_000574400 [Pleodorina starrii]
MDEGPRYPGSLVVQHAKQQAMEIIDKYRLRRKRATELPRAVSLLLAWEGAIVAGAFLAAIAHVAAGAYIMERFDERTRRTSLARYYQQRTELAAEAVTSLQASIAYYSRHAAAVERQLNSSTAAARECQRRVAERRRQLEQELAAGLGLGSTGGGSSGGGPLAAALAPWRSLYVRWRLDGWRRELERLDREARELERSLQHDQLLVDQARDKVYLPTWMDDDEGFDHPPARGEAPGDRDEETLDEAADGDADSIGSFLSELRPLLGNSLPRW